jgi:hypothetical protein
MKVKRANRLMSLSIIDEIWVIRRLGHSTELVKTGGGIKVFRCMKLYCTFFFKSYVYEG